MMDSPNRFSCGILMLLPSPILGKRPLLVWAAAPRTAHAMANTAASFGKQASSVFKGWYR
jgi:hypothetical protein